MVHIEVIDLCQRGVTLPSDRIGMVIAQPFISLSVAEPYQCIPQAIPEQLVMLTDTLTVARAAPHGENKTHFTIFPEYSIPGLEGIALIEDALQADDWPSGTIVIGGVDALSKSDFDTLAGKPGTHLDTVRNSLDRIMQNEWINCAITWVKGETKIVERWLQPKLKPAGPERNAQFQEMFRGDSVFVFKGPFSNGGQQYHFSSLVCFDWIATQNGEVVWRGLLDALGKEVVPYEIPLSWLFVIQHNDRPSHDTFLLEVREFFDQNIVPNVRRDRTCLVFANSAGKASPGRTNIRGGTSLIFSDQAQFDEPVCKPTFSNGGRRYRSSTLLSPYKDIFFREGGACIHSFVQINAGSLAAGPAGRMLAVEQAFVYPLNGIDDPRVPSRVVPACVKWLNDELDDLPSLTATANYGAAPLAAQADSAHLGTIAALRVLSHQSITHTVNLAAIESTGKHADEWGQIESDALTHVVHTLDIICIGCATSDFGDAPAHATTVINNQTVDVLAIRGMSHPACIEHSRDFLSSPQRQVLLVSRDPDNSSWSEKFGSFLQSETPQLGQEVDITNPDSGLLHVGYRDLLDIFTDSATEHDIQAGIDAKLAA